MFLPMMKRIQYFLQLQIAITVQRNHYFLEKSKTFNKLPNIVDHARSERTQIMKDNTVVIFAR